MSFSNEEKMRLANTDVFVSTLSHCIGFPITKEEFVNAAVAAVAKFEEVRQEPFDSCLQARQLRSRVVSPDFGEGRRYSVMHRPDIVDNWAQAIVSFACMCCCEDYSDPMGSLPADQRV